MRAGGASPGLFVHTQAGLIGNGALRPKAFMALRATSLRLTVSTLPDVAAQLKAAVNGRDVIADSYFDDSWSRILFHAAGDAAHLPVHCLAEIRAFNDVANDRLRAALDSVDLQRSRRHRAEDDARWLASLLVELGIDRPVRIPQARAA